MSLRYATTGDWEREGPWASNREKDSSDEEDNTQQKYGLSKFLFTNYICV